MTKALSSASSVTGQYALTLPENNLLLQISLTQVKTGVASVGIND